MPTGSIWGYIPNDAIEFRSGDHWFLGYMVMISSNRAPIVRGLDGMLHEINDPRNIRLWDKPSTASEIESYLNQ